jgi:DNA-binding response OmpR family regulator
MKHTVAIIEDDTAISDILRHAFTEAGFEVIGAHDGKEGIRLVEEEKPDVILLDIVLPGTDGVSVIGALKENPAVRDIPVFMLTSLGGSQEVAEAMESGAQEYLIKGDWRIEEVVQKVKDCVRGH